MTVPGFSGRGTEDAGRPDLPLRGFPFGLPEGTAARVSARVLSSVEFDGIAPMPVPARAYVPGDPTPVEEDTYTPDPSVYGSAAESPAEIVTLGPVQGWRHQRVQSVVVSPVQVEPASGHYRAATRIEVTVTFDRTAQKPGESVLPPGLRMVPAGADAPGWDALQDRTLVNGASAGAFRTRAERAPLRTPFDPSQVFIRVRIGTTGFCRLSFETLSGAGFPAGRPVGEVRVEERGYDNRQSDPFTVTSLPREVEDANGNGVFDAGDYVDFYGFNYRDRFHPQVVDARYSYFHTYWVTASSEGGKGFAVSDGYPEGDGYTAAASFPQTDHYEQNKIYINNPPDSGSSIYPNKTALYWLDPSDVDASLTTTALNPDPDGEYRIVATWQGLFTTNDTYQHRVSLALNSCQILTDGAFERISAYTFDSGSRPIAGCLAAGANTVHLTGHTPTSNATSGAYFDAFDLTYDRQLIAVDNELVFNTGDAAGKLEFDVSGFRAGNVQVLDVTDPVNPFRLTPQVEGSGHSWTAKLRVNVTGLRRTYVALVPDTHDGLPASDHALPPDLGTDAVARGLTRDLVSAGEGSDYILLTHPSFRDAWTPLIQYRESQGYHVFLCDVIEIYDEFAGGDKTPWAIQRFLADAYQTWDPSPSYLLLGGDANEDYRHDIPFSTPDYVPTLMHFANVPGTGGKELAGTDSWYAAFLRPGESTNDVLPELHVGRLPVDSAADVQTVVQKIIDYENMQPGDDWRNRGVFMADDQYSSGLTIATNYCYKEGELTFHLTTAEMADSIRVKGKLPDFQFVPFFLDAYLDTVAALDRHPGDLTNCPSVGTLETSRYARDHVTPLIVSLLSQGHLIFEYTGHANRSVMTTEQTLVNYPTFSLPNRDFDRVNNLGKPFVFFGYACHLDEFEYAQEASRGRGIGEVLMMEPNKGAIASIASTGYEWLHTNSDAQTYTTRSLFWDLPRDPLTRRPERILGDCMTRAFAQNDLEHGGLPDWREMLRTYVTLGDPALRIDVESADFAVKVNDQPFDAGSRLTASSFQDSVTVEATISDDVDVSSVRVMDGQTQLPAGRLAVVPPDSTDQGAQAYTLRFKTTLRLGNYDLAIEATDWTGRVSTFTLPVRFESGFSADGKKLGGGGGEFVDSTAVIEVKVASPVPLAEDALTLVVDGSAVSPVVTKLDAEGRQWTLDYQRTWDAGQHRVELRVNDRNGGDLTQTVSFQVSGETFSLLNTFFYPNPADGPGGQLVYTLNKAARDARITVYSVAGRRVLRTDIPSRAGTNAYVWDLRDQEGDLVANGVYLFLLELTDTGGKHLRRLERVAVAR